MIANIFRITYVFALITMLTACGTVGDWFKDDVYEVPPAELTTFTQEFEPTVAWSTDTGGSDDGYSSLAPWLQGNMIVAIDSEGEVNSYDVKTGKRQWRVALKVPVSTGVGGGDGLILVGTREGNVLALDELNGNLLWKVKLSSEILAPPKADQGVVVASSFIEFTRCECPSFS